MSFWKNDHYFIVNGEIMVCYKKIRQTLRVVSLLELQNLLRKFIKKIIEL